jgi:hypothetical protein
MNKNLKYCFSFLFLMSSILVLHAQNGMNFQGVARNNNGVILASQAIAIRLSIVQGSVNGNIEYQETKIVNTNAQGLFNVVIGDGTSSNTTGNYANINWQLNPKYIKIEMDGSAGNNFINLGTTQLQYVAYAHFADGVAADNITGILPLTKGGTGVTNLQDLKSALQLNNVNNTTDLLKPISTVTQSALNLKLNIADSTASYITPTQFKNNKFDTTYVYQALSNKASINAPNFTGTVTGITKSMIGLSNVDNTSDLNKGISSATQSALNSKLNIADSTASYITPTQFKNNKFDTIYVYQALSNKASINAPNFTGTVTGITKSMVGLSNVDNTSDLNKGISSATQTALTSKENITNKSAATDLGGANPSDDLYPTQKAVKEYVAANSNAGGIADYGVTSIKLATASVTNDKIAGIIPVSLGGTGTTSITGIKTSLGLNSAAYSSTNDFESPIIVTAPLSRTANTISISAAGTLTNGYLSKIDWNNFNAKQNALTAGVDYLTPNGNAATATYATSAGTASTSTQATTATYATSAGNITATSNTSLTSLNNLNTVSTIISGVWSATTISVAHGGTGSTTSTGTGSVVLSTSPSLTTPNIGAATGTSLNLSGGLIASNAVISGTITANSFVGDGSGLTNISGTLTDNSVTSSKILDATIINQDINANAGIEYAKLNLSNSIIGSDIVNGTITSNKLTGTDITTLGTISSGVWSSTAIAVAHGGTGATTVSAARNNLGLGSAALNSTSDFAQIAATGNTFQGDVKAKTYTLTNPSAVNSTSNTTLDLSSGNVLELVLISNTNLAFTNPKVGTYIIKIKQDATGNHLLTFPTIKWSDQSAPTITAAANATDLITLIYDGTDFYASCLQNF